MDTSSWIHLLRPNGDPAVRGRVEFALRAGGACWCPIVHLELRNGARGNRKRRVLQDFAAVIPVLPIDDPVWIAAYDLARHARDRGATVPATDTAITACAAHHGAAPESTDKDIDLLRNVQVLADGHST